MGAAQHRPQWIIDHFAGGTVTTGEAMLQTLKSSSETLGSFLRKATMVQISWSGTGGLLAARLGMPVILMPCLITQTNSWGRRTLTTSLRLGGGFSPAAKSPGFTPGAP